MAYLIISEKTIFLVIRQDISINIFLKDLRKFSECIVDIEVDDHTTKIKDDVFDVLMIQF